MFTEHLGPRHLQAANEILRLCREHPGIAKGSLIRMLEDYGHECSSSVTLLIEMGYLRDEAGIFSTSDIEQIDLYREILFEEAKSNSIFRGLLLNIGPLGNQRELMVNYYQMLNEASLLECEDLTVLKWWSSIREMARRSQDDGDDDVGILGEYLSFNFEIKRLGIEDIEWTSRWHGDSYGYDIKSYHDNSMEDKRYIEVKSSSQSVDRAKIHLTHNEYRKLCQLGDDYFLHLWSEVEVDEEDGSGPIEVPGSMVQNTLNEIDPKIVGWSGAITIPFDSLLD